MSQKATTWNKFVDFFTTIALKIVKYTFIIMCHKKMLLTLHPFSRNYILLNNINLETTKEKCDD